MLEWQWDIRSSVARGYMEERLGWKRSPQVSLVQDTVVTQMTGWALAVSLLLTELCKELRVL